MGVGRLTTAGASLAAITLIAAGARAQAEAPPEERFRRAGSLITAGDYPGGLALYRELAAAGHESASLYWNWAQASGARGANGEALWALMRARELEPGDAALVREIERLRVAGNLDPAEIAPQPLAAVARIGRRLHLDWLASALLLLSLLLHGIARGRPTANWATPASWTSLVVGLLATLVLLLGSLAKPGAVVVRPDAPLLDAASPTANALGALREGEVVPLLARSGAYVRLEDSSGARGWAHQEDVRPVDRPLPAAR